MSKCPAVARGGWAPLELIDALRCYDLSSAADAGNNACGLGFNGYDSNGNELWNRITNVNALEVEVSVYYFLISS